MKVNTISSQDRRTFLKQAGYSTGALAMATMFSGLTVRAARAQTAGGLGDLVGSPFGEAVAATDLDTGLDLLKLPPRFSYNSLGWVGDTLSGGSSQTTPSRHDGGAIVSARGGIITYIRNHEVTTGETHNASGSTFFDASPGESGGSRGNFNVQDALDGFASGGCTRLIYSARSRRLLRADPGIGATQNNCAGGFNPFARGRGGWITCEENFGAGGRTHGFAFEVPAQGFASGVPLKQMGRMEHEAVAIDPRTGVVLLTEDNSPTHSGIYLFVPDSVSDVRRNGGYTGRRDELVPGKLYMLAVKGRPNEPMTNRSIGDTFEIESVEIPQGEGPGEAAGPPIPVSDPLSTAAFGSFITGGTRIVDPRSMAGNGAAIPGFSLISRTSSSSSPYVAGFAQGGAIFARPEGAWFDERSGCFVFLDTNAGPDNPSLSGTSSSTNTGAVYVFKPDLAAPQNGTLEVVYVGSTLASSNGPDNITVHPTTGTLFICEDGDQDVQRLLAVTPSGDTFVFAENNIVLTQDQVANTMDMNGVWRNPDFIDEDLAGAATASTPVSFMGAEWAGASFSPDGDTLFVNIQGPGWTFAITGPFNEVLRELA